MYRLHGLAAATAVFALPIITLPSIVQAGGFFDSSNVVTLGFSSYQPSNSAYDNVNVFTFDFAGKLAFTENLLLDYDFSAGYGDNNQLNDGVTGLSLGLAPKYRFSGMPITVGAYVEYALGSAFGQFDDLHGMSYGGTLGYDNSAWSAELFYGATTVDDAFPGNADVTDYGLLVSYTASDQLSFGANLMRTDIEESGNTGTLDVIALAAAYQMNDSWGLFGGYGHAQFSGFGQDADGEIVGLGVSYYLGNTFSVPVTASLEVARANGSLNGTSESANLFRLGVSIPLGGTGPTLPLNSIAGGVMNPRHSAISNAAQIAF